MQVTNDTISETRVKITIVADTSELEKVKQHVVRELGRNVRVQGFRAGKAPAHLIEKQLEPSALQTEFLDHAVNELYVAAIKQIAIRPTVSPDVSITKFVPFSTLEFTAEVDVVGKLVLPDYTKLKLPKPEVKVTAKDVDEVITNLRLRAATRKDVTRASKDGDELTIDFSGVDAKTKEPIEGAEGKDYPLVLGSKTFIPGFEDKLIGAKAGETKTFPLTFPKDYGMTQLRSAKVSFTVTVQSVKQIVEPKLDDTFAASIGPFKTVTELKTDIKRQLEVEKTQQARSDYNNTLLETIANQTTVAIPDSLVETEIDRIEDEERRNLVYRGQTWEEHLEAEGITDKEHRDKNRDGAILRIKAGIILTEVSVREGVEVTPEELNRQIALLKGRYTDEKMIAELDKPEGRRDIASRILSEKTIDKLAEFATA